MAIYPGLDARDIELRRLAFERFSAWEASHRFPSDPARNLRSVAWLWQMLPEDARERPVDPTGVTRMRQALAVLGRGR